MTKMTRYNKIAHRVLSRYALRHRPLAVKFIRDPNKRVAATIDEILKGLSKDVLDRSGDVKVRLKDHPLPFDWDFMATSGDSKYEVSVRALTEEEGKVLVKNADILVACSCPFWQWQGPEHHAKQGDYLFGKPRGTASKPTEKDPKGGHHVCKHVAKVLDTIRFYVIGD